MGDKTILIADDEQRITDLVSDFLKNAGYDTLVASDGAQALKIVKENRIDLAIIDIMMPEINGWELTKMIRKDFSFPIIMLSARSEEFDQLEGFESGADEYVTKPFSPAVLVKRVDALLNLNQKAQNSTSEKGLTIDKTAFTVKIDGKPLELTYKEYELIFLLYDNAGHVLSREQLLDSIWGYDYLGDYRTVDSHIARLRTKLGDWGNNLKTVYGMGYKLEI